MALSSNLLPRPRMRHWLVQYPRAIPLAIFALVAAVTALSMFGIEREQGFREKAALREAATSIGAALERRGATNSAYLRAGAALFSTTDQVPREMFVNFIAELRLGSNYRGAEGVGWAELIEPGAVPEFEARLSAEMGRDIQVFSDTGAEETYEDVRYGKRRVVVTFLQPENERNRRAIGFDMYSEKVRRTAMDTATQQRRPISTTRTALVEDGDEPRFGFVIYMPVFAREEMGGELLGFIYSPVVGQDFLTSALELADPGTRGVRLYDGNPASGKLLASHAPAVQTGETISQEISVAQEPMTLVIESGADGSLSSLSLLTLLFGFMVAGLLMTVARLISQQATEDQAALDWLEEQNQIRNSLTRELNHRVKNTLANVLSIIALTRRRATSVDDLADSLSGRVRSLSATHDLLTKSEWSKVPLRDIIETEIAPYARKREGVATMMGPDVELSPKDSLSLGLAVHELATNAAKYGAFSQEGGTVVVIWEKEQDDLVRVEWLERGGPPVKQASKKGFGTELIERIVAHELQQPVDLKFEEEGVHCVLRVPIRSGSEFALRAGR